MIISTLVCTDSSRGGRLSYPFSSASSTEMRSEEEVAGWVGCTPRFGDLVVDLWEEWWSSSTRGLKAPRQEPFIRAATGRFLWGRQFQTQLLYSVRQDAEKIGVHAWAGCAGMRKMQGGGVVVRARPLLHIWSRQWQAVIHIAVIASTEWDQIARSRRGMLVRAGDENGWKLSVSEVHRGTAGVTSLIFECWDPLPHCFFITGPWEEKAGGREGQSFSLKEC